MKRNLIAFIAFTLLFAACSPDDDNEQENQNNNSGIVSKWMVVSLEVAGQVHPIEHKCPSNPQGDYVEFKSNGNWESKKYTSGCDVSLIETYTGTYTLSGNDLTVFDNGTTHNFEITTLNSTTLIYQEYVNPAGIPILYITTYERIN